MILRIQFPRVETVSFDLLLIEPIPGSDEQLNG